MARERCVFNWRRRERDDEERSMDTKHLSRQIETDRAPHPQGHYAQGRAQGSQLFISGQLPLALDGTPRTDLDFEGQTRLALAHLIAIAEAGGSGLDRILKVTAYVTGVENWPAFNKVYAEIFGAHRPARTVVPVPALHHGCLIELDAIAFSS
jgi:2-iminobutanoate/2-iminopropanoate deaminase